MVRPLIRLVRDDRGARNWEFDSGAAALQLAFAGDVPLGEFVLEDGTLDLREPPGRRDRAPRFGQSDARLDERAAAARRVGLGIWRGEQVTFTASADAPFDFMNGKPTPLDARLDSAPISVVFTGAAADLEAPRLTGELEPLDALAPRLRRLARQPDRPRLDARPGQPLRHGALPRQRALGGERGA